MIKNYRGPKKRYIGEERKKGRIRPTFQLWHLERLKLWSLKNSCSVLTLCAVQLHATLGRARLSRVATNAKCHSPWGQGTKGSEALLLIITGSPHMQWDPAN